MKQSNLELVENALANCIIELSKKETPGEIALLADVSKAYAIIVRLLNQLHQNCG